MLKYVNICTKKVGVFLVVFGFLASNFLYSEMSDKEQVVLSDMSELAIRSQSYSTGAYWEDFFLVGLVGATLEAGFNQFVSLNSVKDIQFFILFGATVALLGRRLAVKLFEQFGGHGDSEQVMRMPQELVEEFVKNNSTKLQRVGDL